MGDPLYPSKPYTRIVGCGLGRLRIAIEDVLGIDRRWSHQNGMVRELDEQSRQWEGIRTRANAKEPLKDIQGGTIEGTPSKLYHYLNCMAHDNQMAINIQDLRMPENGFNANFSGTVRILTIDFVEEL